MKLILLFEYVLTICLLNDFCFDVIDKGGNLEITVQNSRTFGWVAIGIGSSMMGSDMMVIWKAKNQTNYILSDRKSSGFSNPTPYAVQSLYMVKSDDTSFTFTRPKAIDDGHITVEGTMDWIWAYSNKSPNSDDYSATITKHNQAGVLSINPQGDIVTESMYKDNSKLLWHGILMFISWNSLPFIGISIASTYRNHFPVSWFRIHVLCFSLLFLTSIASFVLAVLGTKEQFQKPHPIIGLVITILMVIQVSLGIIIDRLYNVDRKSVPWYDSLHHYIGRLVFIFAQVNIFFGLLLWDTPSNMFWFLLGYSLILTLEFIIYLLPYLDRKKKN